MIEIFSLLYDRKNELKLRDKNIVGSVFDLYENFESMGLEKREGQFNLALDISEAIRDKKNLIVEAGVGIGKSLGYLIPALYTIKYTGRPIVIATSSIQLTEQLKNDVRQASELTGIPVSAVVGKGRRNYSCKYRVIKAREKGKIQLKKPKMKKIVEWVLESETGEQSDAQMHISNAEWENVNIQNCLYEKCDYRNECGFYKMRAGINGYYNDEVIIVNQDLLIANLLKVSEGGSTLINEKYEAIIIDEAHNLEEKTRNRLTEEWNLYRLYNMIDNLFKLLSRRVDYDANIKENIDVTKEHLDNMFKDIYVFVEQELLKDENNEIERVEVGLCNFDPSDLLLRLTELYQMIQLEFGNERIQDSLIEEVKELIKFIENINIKDVSNLLFWGDIKKSKKEKGITVCYAPKDIAQRLNNILFRDEQSVILTSATMTQPGQDLIQKYSYQINSVGFEGDYAEIKDSPFPFNENSRIYIPNDIVPPKSKNKDLYLQQISERIEELIKITEGRTLVLFTAKSDMECVYKTLIKRSKNIKILRQLEGSNQVKVIEEFRESKGVLLSTGILWEGIDIPGPELSSVIITRLPFPVPDPIINYKTKNSTDPINEILVPEMIKHLRQGAGRLIRTENDKGLLSILDSRLSEKYKKGYRESVLEMLPIKKQLNSLQDVKRYVNEQLKPSF